MSHEYFFNVNDSHDDFENSISLGFMVDISKLLVGNMAKPMFITRYTTW